MRNQLSLLFTTIIFVFFCATIFYIYHEQKTQQHFLHKIQQDMCVLTPHEHQNSPEETKCWSDLQSVTRDTVVQMFVYQAQFNWLEPYKSPQQAGSLGSGFFIKDDGSILTNAHVIDQSKSIQIQIPSLGKQRFEVELVGVSPERDLALVRLKEEDRARIVHHLGKIPVLPLGNSDNVHRADEIMALGYPLGQQGLKSTTGVVSGREHIGGRNLIQISAAINPGSSGGPSLNRAGSVIGINSAGITEAQNVGYIIPSNEVKLFLHQLEQIQDTGTIKFIRKPFLGILFNNASETVTTFLGNPGPGGLYVVETYKGSPLDKAGVLPSDMIYTIDGHHVDIFGEISVPWSEDKISIVDYVSRLMVGDKVHMIIYRKGKKKELKLTFDQAELAPIRGMFPAYEKIDYEVVGGLVVMQLALNHLPLLLQSSPDLTHYMELKNQMEPALVVTHIFPNSEAMGSRTITAGATVGEINGVKVRTLEEFRNAIKKSAQTGYLTLKTTENVFTVLKFDKLLEDEKKLSYDYRYQITPFTQELIHQYAKNNN